MITNGGENFARLFLKHLQGGKKKNKLQMKLQSFFHKAQTETPNWLLLSFLCYMQEQKLMNLMTSTKIYWSILDTFLSNRKNSGIASLFHENKNIKDFKNESRLV